MREIVLKQHTFAFPCHEQRVYPGVCSGTVIFFFFGAGVVLMEKKNLRTRYPVKSLIPTTD
jgi:hypothetical protein